MSKKKKSTSSKKEVTKKIDIEKIKDEDLNKKNDLEEKEIKIPLPKIMLNKNYETTFGSDFSIEDGILTIKVKANGVDVLTEK